MRLRRAIALWLGIILLGAGSAWAKEGSTLLWKPGRVVDADINGWPIRAVLGQIAALTGWKVYVEPGLDQVVSVSFKGLPEGQALRLLLRQVNYALVREQESPSRLYVYRDSMGRATDLIAPDHADKPANWLANELIVTLAPGAKEDMEKLAASLGGKLVGSSEDLNAYRLQFEDAETAQKAREKLAARSDLEVSDNYEFARPDSAGQTFSPNSMAFGIDPTPVAQGDQIRVAVVDTPVQPLDGKMQDFLLPSIDIVEGAADLGDSPSHGTSMVYTLLNSLARMDQGNTAGRVRIQPVDIYGGNASTTTFEVAIGLKAAIQQNPHIINLSLGGEGFSPLVEHLIQIAYEKEIMVLAAAGNSPTTAPTYPAASPYAIAVTAAMPDGSVAPWANHGDFVDVKAPGTALVRYNGHTFVSTGTSTATAFTGGFAAALAAQGKPTREISHMMLTGEGLQAAVSKAGQVRP